MVDTNKLYEQLENDPAASAASKALASAGGKVYIVGGAVRDTLLGKTPKDVDLMVANLPRQDIENTLRQLPGYTVFAGKNFGVYHYRIGNSVVEIAMPRTERSTGSGHKDFEVNADPNIPVETDLHRRDFTSNAMAFDIATGQLIDPHNGQEDIATKKLRLISAKSFEDDPLRIVRALVSNSVHGLQPDENTLQEMTNNAAKLKNLPNERIQMELDKLLSGTDPAGAIQIAYETGVLDYICPELEQTFGFDQQSQYHDLDVGEHSLQVLRHMSTITTDPDMRLAALLHDIGKPDSAWVGEDGYRHFYANPEIPGAEDHEDISARMAYEYMKRMAYPNERINRVVGMIQNHMFPYFSSETGARKFLNTAGDSQTAYDLMDLREADSHGKNSGQINESDKSQLDLGRSLLDKVLSQNNAFTAKNLLINGNDLIQMGIEPGPQMGYIIQKLVEAVIEDPSLNTKDGLTQYVKEMLDGGY